MQTAFTPENFQKAFKPYRVKFAITYSIVMCPILIFCLCIGIPNWQFSQWLISVIMDGGMVYDGRTLHYGIFAIGMNLAHIIGVGLNVAAVFAVGVNACGIIVIGTNAVGVIAVGANACGIVAIGTNAVGVIVIAVGGWCYGLYVLSGTQRGKGKYLFAPHRRDDKAVVFFTSWFPRLAESCLQDESHNVQ